MPTTGRDSKRSSLMTILEIMFQEIDYKNELKVNKKLITRQNNAQMAAEVESIRNFERPQIQIL